MNNDTFAQKFSLPMRWLALAAVVEIALVMLSATAVQSQPLASMQAVTVTAASPLVGYAHDFAQAIRRSETGLPSIQP